MAVQKHLYLSGGSYKNMGTYAVTSHSYLHQILVTLQSGVCALNFAFTVCFFLISFKGFTCLKYVYGWILIEMSHSE